MPEKTLNGLRVAILATQNFEEAELIEPRKALDEAGAITKAVAPKPGKIQAMKHDVQTIAVNVDLTLDKINPDDFDAVLLPGGALNADVLRVEKKAQDFIRQMDGEGKPIAVICHGSWLLISAEIVEDRTMTSYHTIQDDLRNAGAQWVDKEVVIDDNWVSSRQPSDIPAFNREMIKLFAQRVERNTKVA